MKKLATLLILFSLGLFTVGTIAGCGGGKDKDKPADKPATDTPATDS